ncbi:MAG: hypothetical protein RLO50_04305 [Azospirillaceae bacterium]
MTETPPANWRGIVEEFRIRPFGQHSADLQALLDRFRAEPIEGKPFLYMVEQHRRWALAHFSTTRPLTWTVERDTVFTRIEDAEWHVFRRRWQDRYGFDPEGA